MNRLFIVFLLACCSYITAQETTAVPFAILEQVPVYPGCKGDNLQLKACMSKSIQRFVNDDDNCGWEKKKGKGFQHLFGS